MTCFITFAESNSPHMNNRTILVCLFSLLLAATSCNQQEAGSADNTQNTAVQEAPADNSRANRPSPPDSTAATLGDLTVSIQYGSPSVKGREIWGALVPYGEVWRTGANEATTIEITSDALVAGNPVLAGIYSLFTIPGEEEWTIILNKTANLWGSYEYNQEEDALRFQTIASKTDAFSERMTFSATTQSDGYIQVLFHWENLTFSFPVALP